MTPEALAGGPLGRVREGDEIEITIDRVRLEGSVNLVVNGDAEEGARELAARPLREDEGLGRRQIVDGDEVVGDELHLAAMAEGPDVFLGARDAREHLLRALERCRVAAAEDDEILPRRLRTGAANRAVEQDLALSRERGAAALLRLERERAALDDDLPLAVARCDAALAGRHLLEGVDAGERGDQDLDPLSDVARLAGGDAAGFGEALHRRLGDVEAHDLEPRAGKHLADRVGIGLVVLDQQNHRHRSPSAKCRHPTRIGRGDHELSRVEMI